MTPHDLAPLSATTSSPSYNACHAYHSSLPARFHSNRSSATALLSLISVSPCEHPAAGGTIRSFYDAALSFTHPIAGARTAPLEIFSAFQQFWTGRSRGVGLFWGLGQLTPRGPPSSSKSCHRCFLHGNGVNCHHTAWIYSTASHTWLFCLRWFYLELAQAALCHEVHRTSHIAPRTTLSGVCTCGQHQGYYSHYLYTSYLSTCATAEPDYFYPACRFIEIALLKSELS